MAAIRIYRRFRDLLDVTFGSPSDGDVPTYSSSTQKLVMQAPTGGGGGGAPTDATYITQTANGSLSAEQALSTLATGVVKVTTGTGVLSAAAEGTDYYKPGATDVAVADGGTGASTAATARSNLGLVIGTDVEAHDTDLTTIAGLTPANDDVIQRKAGVWANRTIAQVLVDLAAAGTTFQPLDSDLTAVAALTTTSYGRALLTLATAAAADFNVKASNLSDVANAGTARTNLGVAIGSNVQAWDADLDAIAALTSAANKMPYSTAAQTWALADLTAFARTFLDDADAATVRATLGVIASLFQSGGGQALALDTLAATTDITTLNASTSAHGLLRKLDNTATHFLDGTGAWSTPASSGGTGVYGDGSDGTVTFDGSTTILGLAPSSSIYTLTRDIFLATGTINNGVTISTNGFRVFCSGTLTNNGTISWNGSSASANSGGFPATSNANSTINGGTSTSAIGTSGLNGVGSGTGGTAGTAVSSSRVVVGGAGGAGGTGNSGGNAGGAGGSNAGAAGSYRGLPYAVMAQAAGAGSAATAQIINICGGASGGSGGGGTSGNSGGSGSGGGIVVVVAKTLTGTGAIQARGGNGASSGTNTGGGGGGGGGGVFIVSGSVSGGAVTGQTIDANGGTGGNGSGTGAAGSNGGSGTTVLVAN